MSATEALALTTSPTSPATAAQPVPLSRGQILQATTRCLCEQGYDATTIRTIAGQLGCAVGSIYRYFRDKHDLMLAVTQELLEPIAAAAVAGQPVADNIREYHRLVTGGAECYRLMFWLACQQQGPTPGAPTTHTARLPDVIERIVTAWGRTLGDTHTARRAWSTLHGMILMSCPVDECLAALDPLLSAGRSHHRDRPGRATPDVEPATPEVSSPAAHAAAPQSIEPRGDNHATSPAVRDDVCLL